MALRSQYKSLHTFILFILSCFFLAFAYAVLDATSSGPVTTDLSRGFRNLIGGEWRRIEIERLACGYGLGYAVMEEDDAFAAYWVESHDFWDFDIVDIDNEMMRMCPPTSDEEIDTRLAEYFKGQTRPDLYQDSLKNWEKRTLRYKIRILSRDFSALKHEPKSKVLQSVDK